MPNKNFNKNPLDVFGVPHDIVKSLPYKDILRLAEHIYKGMQKIYHPDVSSVDTQKSIELNEAINILRDEKNYDFLKRYYLKPKSYKKLYDSLSVENTNLKSNIDNIANALLDYFKSFFGAESRDDKLNAFDYPLKLIVYNYAIAMNKSRNNLLTNINKDFEMINIIFLNKKDDVKIVDNSRKNEYVFKNKFIIGSINGSILANYRNSIRNFFENICVTKKNNNRFSIDFGDSYKKDKKVDITYTNIILPDNLKTILPFLSPYLNEGDFVLSLNYNDNGDVIAIIEGKLIKYEKI